jgi:predicted ATPase
VVGAGAGKESDVFGDTPNIAARVQAAAAPGTVLISADAHRLVSGLFVVEDRGAQALKGIERSVQLYRVVQPSGVRGRFEAAAATRGLTPFVGREDELRLLMSRWERALDGEGQVALVIGEAGIGKSRLVQRFREQIAGTPHTWVEAAAGAFSQNTPFYAVTEMLRELLAWRGDESAEGHLTQLETSLALAGLKPAEVLLLIAPLLNLSIPTRYPPLSLSPEQQRRRLLATLVEWVLGAARVQPTIIATEDLHWIDPSTLELIQLLVEQGATSRLLLVYTARPDFHAPWAPRAHHAQITLNRLSSRNVRTMVGEVAAQKALSEETIATVVERTGGVPLFVEELTRVVLESGNARLPGREIPVTLHDSLMARLDRLGPAKEVAQIGAVIGRAFSYEFLHAVHTAPEDELQAAVKVLTDAELLYVRGIPPEAMYTFKHALIQDAAYEALLKTRRRELHRRVASVLSDQFAEIAEAQPEILAHHYTEAGLGGRAIPYWQTAGQRAVERSAHIEAISHLTRGLELLNTLSDSPERAREELILQTTLSHALTPTRGWADPSVGKTYARCLELCQQTGDSSQLSRALAGFWAFYAEVPQLKVAQELGEQLVSLAPKTNDRLLLAEAHLLLGFTVFFRGEITSARDHLQQAIASHASVQGPSRVGLYGYDPRVPCWFVMACALWVLGYPDQALKRSEETLALTQELSHPYSSAVGLYWAAMFHRLRREMRSTEERAQDLIALCTEQGFTLFLAWGTILCGSALAEKGEREQGIADIQRGLTAHQATGGALRQPYWLSLLAEAYGDVGNVEEALTVLAEALKVVGKTEECWWEAELYRLKGQLTLQKGARSWRLETSLSSSQVPNVPPLVSNGAALEADGYFLKAIETASRQHAKSLELRAATSLSRLWQQQGKRREAHELLSTIYGWFTEGFDTADLKDAKALLDELAE